MSDLISRSRAISILEQLNEHSLSGKMDILNAIYLLENQPTAYDVDKVIEEFKTDTSVKLYGSLNSRNYMIPVDRAVEIVKQGGVSDDVCEWRLCDEEANVYDTSCRNPHILIEGTPEENNYKFCPYCGKKIKIVGD